MNGSSENAYTILETLFKSRNHCIYKAKNQVSGQLVTIKTTEQRWRNDLDQNLQLKAEGETGLKLIHPNIRATLGIFEDDGTVYVVRDYSEGQTLSALLAKPGAEIGSSDADKWAMQLLEALAYAHAQQIVHLNLNPDNILITSSNDLLLLGFGDSKKAWQAYESIAAELHPVLFLAPELFLGDSTDERSDIYSAGVLIYLLFCGQLPWSLDWRESPSLLKQQTLQRPVLDPELLGKHVPHWLFTILNRSLMLDPELRFHSVSRLISALRSQQEIPYESCLKRSDWTKTPVPVPGPERLVTEPKPVPPPEPQAKEIPQEAPPVPVYIPPAPKIEPEPAPPPRVADPPPPPKQRMFSVPEPDRSSEQTESLAKTGKLFRTFGRISLLIVLFIIVKYCVLSRTPKFSKPEQEPDTELTESKDRPDNAPIPMISVPGDSTVIGNIGSDADDDEFPPHEVWIPPFQISPHETTREQWAMAIADYPYAPEDKYIPITGVSFYEVLEYCNAKSELDGLNPCYEFTANSVDCDFSANGYRLPTEAEWEYAAKGRLREDFTRYSGSNTPDAVGWYNGNSEGEVHPVGQKPANQLDLYDMSGNVYEWVWNWYARYTWKQNTLYEGPPNGTDKVIRGGSWYHGAREMRVTDRKSAKPHSNTNYIGFRLVRTKK